MLGACFYRSEALQRRYEQAVNRQCGSLHTSIHYHHEAFLYVQRSPVPSSAASVTPYINPYQLICYYKNFAPVWEVMRIISF